MKGKQKELINVYKSRKNLTWNQLSDRLNIKYGRLKTYFDETSLIPEEIYNKLDLNKDYSKYILEKLPDNWGVVKGGLNSIGNLKEINEPADSVELAEFYGAMLGDGNSHKTQYYNSRNNKRGVFAISIVGDFRFDRDYLIFYIKKLIENLFEIKVNYRFIKGKNVLVIEAYGSKLVSFLEKKGFVPGNKIKNKLGIPFWIKSNNDYLRACLRGLYDTDGSVYKLGSQNSYQICFTNKNKILINDVRNSLLKLGINCSKISGKDLYITKKSELRKFLKLVGFRNNKHLRKIKMWKLDSPVV